MFKGRFLRSKLPDRASLHSGHYLPRPRRLQRAKNFAAAASRWRLVRTDACSMTSCVSLFPTKTGPSLQLDRNRALGSTRATYGAIAKRLEHLGLGDTIRQLDRNDEIHRSCDPRWAHGSWNDPKVHATGAHGSTLARVRAGGLFSRVWSVRRRLLRGQPRKPGP